MTTDARPDGERAASLLALRRSWRGLAAPGLDDLVGDLRADFLPPLRRVAPVGLGLVGLPRWWGKRFRPDDGAGVGAALAGVNLVRPRSNGAAGQLVETLPMTARMGTSLVDERPAIVISYAADGPRPWRWVRDEVRCDAAGSLVAMTFVDVAGLRRAGGTPFLLQRP
ncbi:hypothetical protein [Nocardioides pacificus]